MEFLAGVPAQEKAAPEALFLTEESSRGGRLRRCVKSPPESSSSVGLTGESSESEEEEEEDGTVSSQGRWLDSFSSSLEDSLPIKYVSLKGSSFKFQIFFIFFKEMIK